MPGIMVAAVWEGQGEVGIRLCGGLALRQWCDGVELRWIILSV